ncbi:hypothetical protein FIBSPDRAFT_1039991 [Athelia psychrophila]|uniref:DUF6534 domain-containing protein n=1 Tax=Athelia psychrophila TaxID=1759441 RepID=A0A166QXU5_9AGAM|nr:hypothetical protein FIBSPDRAFT_1051985 [Fibularhizoctonia sp. CBS 109695]KZP27676.1 hypothetical protein FIBSPDRAFT_1039991 [Fibularhizoctonia sp. CBS 109695]
MDFTVSQTEWGPALIGITICQALYGMTLAQTGFYFLNYPRDSIYTKALILGLFFFDTFHISLLGYVLWGALLEERALTINLRLDVPWQLLISSAITYSVTFVVQVFFLTRVWKVFDRPRLLVSVIASFALVALGAGMTFVIHNLIESATQDKMSNMSGMLALSGSLVCDVTISASLLFYFQRSRGGLKSTDDILYKLTMLTANTGLLNSIVSVVALAVYQSGGNSFKAFPSHFIQSKLHVNCLLATLNARASIQASDIGESESDEQTWPLHPLSIGSGSGDANSSITAS